jgi:hypothetical protein
MTPLKEVGVSAALRIVIVMGALGWSACAPAADEGSEAEPSLVGSWRLETWTADAGAARCQAEEGSASGQIMYTADGHMSAQLGCSELSLEAVGESSGQEAIARMTRRHFSYYGTYEVDPVARTVTHHVLGSSAPAWVGTDRVRSFVFEGPDRIALTTTESENRLVWVRN